MAPQETEWTFPEFLLDEDTWLTATSTTHIHIGKEHALANIY